MKLRLRDVEIGDLDAYVSMRCDPVMMAELGGPLPREGIEAKVRGDVEIVATGAGWIKMIVPEIGGGDLGSGSGSVPGAAAGSVAGVDGSAGGAAGGPVAGSVVLWSHEEDGETMSEMGWMVLPRFQGRGLAKLAVRTLLEAARDDGRWGRVHAFPGVSNVASNGVCRSVGFTCVGERQVRFADRLLRSSHWVIDPDSDLG